MKAADLGARARLEAAFAREERRGLMVAAATRSAAVIVILGWLALPLRYASFLYFFVLLMQAAFSFRPRWLVWTDCAVPAPGHSASCGS